MGIRSSELGMLPAAQELSPLEFAVLELQEGVVDLQTDLARPTCKSTTPPAIRERLDSSGTCDKELWTSNRRSQPKLGELRCAERCRGCELR